MTTRTSRRHPVAIAALLLALGCGAADEPVDSTPTDPACAKAPTPLDHVLMETLVGGDKRRFRLTVPPAQAGKALALLFAFQGGDGGDWPFPQRAKFEQLAAAEGFVFVQPLAKLMPPNEGAWQLNTTENTRHDLDMVQALIDRLSASYCIDPARIYATGYSLGSMFAYELACHMNETFAAIASFAGTMPVKPASCALKRHVAVLHGHGEDDPIIAYDNSWDWKAWDAVGTMRDIPSLVAFWAEKNGCATKADTTAGAVYHEVHTDCAEDVRVEHYRLQGAGHNWPDSIGGVSTHAVLWDFLSAFTR